jgi:hypothetical protein
MKVLSGSPAALTMAVVTLSVQLSAHDGPPFPIVSNQAAGRYVVSVWTDPDSTDDGSAGGRFWVTLATSNGEAVPPETTVDVAIEPVDGPETTQTVRAVPVAGAVTNQLAALVMDREGRYRVHVAVDGPLGRVDARGEVDATYDLRPPPVLLFVYAVPFVLVAFLWIKLMLKRRSRSGPAVE